MLDFLACKLKLCDVGSLTEASVGDNHEIYVVTDFAVCNGIYL